MEKPRVSVFLGLSLDGYIAGKDGDLSWLSVVETTPPEDTGYQALMQDIDVMVLGRNTYEQVLDFDIWPYTGKHVVVMTHRELEAGHGEVACNGTLTDLLKNLQEAGYQHIYLDGGSVVRQGLLAGLVDQMTLSWVPVILGEGIPLFTKELPMSHWQLVRSCSFPSGLIQGVYLPAPEEKTLS